MIKGVIAVEANVTDINESMSITIAKRDLRDKIYKVLEGRQAEGIIAAMDGGQI